MATGGYQPILLTSMIYRLDGVFGRDSYGNTDRIDHYFILPSRLVAHALQSITTNVVNTRESALIRRTRENQWLLLSK